MTHINQRTDYANNWITANPILQEGEVGWETDTQRSKLGDGVTHWVNLPYTVGKPDVTKADVGLDQVNNTADLNKPISTATQAALDAASASFAAAVSAKVSKFGAPLLNADLNSLTTTGFYHGTGLTNGPSTPTPQSVGFVMVFGDGANYAEQMFRSDALVTGQSGLYHRTYISGTWSAWTEMAGTASPKFTGLPTVPNSGVANYNTTLIANTATVQAILDKRKADEDTGWKLLGSAIPYGAGWSGYASDAWGPPAIRRIGSRVQMRGLVALNVAVAAGGGYATPIFTCPVGYRPSAPAGGMHLGTQNGVNAVARNQVQTGGAVLLNYTSVAMPAGMWWSIDNITYITDDPFPS